MHEHNTLNYALESHVDVATSLRPGSFLNQREWLLLASHTSASGDWKDTHGNLSPDLENRGVLFVAFTGQ